MIGINTAKAQIIPIRLSLRGAGRLKSDFHGKYLFSLSLPRAAAVPAPGGAATSRYQYGKRRVSICQGAILFFARRPRR
jgi:hypothetical protein